MNSKTSHYVFILGLGVNRRNLANYKYYTKVLTPQHASKSFYTAIIKTVKKI